MIRIEGLSRPGGSVNEDAICFKTRQYAVLLDGSTGVNGNVIPQSKWGYRWKSDAQWLVHNFLKTWRRMYDRTLPTEELVRRCIHRLRTMYEALDIPDALRTKEHQPTASLMIARRLHGRNRIELFSLGDCYAYVEESNRLKVDVFHDGTVTKLDRQVLEKAQTIARENRISLKQACESEPIRGMIREHRALKNTPEGYWVLGLAEEAADHALRKEYRDEEISTLLLCSDGMNAYTEYTRCQDDSREFMDRVKRLGIKKIYETLRNAENDDEDWDRFPRLKAHDDASALFLYIRNSNLMQTLNVWIHRVKGKTEGLWMTFGIKRGYVWAFFLLAILLILRFGGSRFGAQFDFQWIDDAFLLPILTVLGTFLKSIIDYRSFGYTYYYVRDNAYRENVLRKVRLTEKQIDAGYAVREFHNGTSIEKYVISERINRYLYNNRNIYIHDVKSRYRITSEVANFIPYVLKQTLNSKRVAFNGKLLRQMQDIYPDTRSVNVQKVGYFDTQCTNELVYKKIKSYSSLEYEFFGDKLLIGSENRLYDLDNSVCANHIGISTLAITRNNQILIGVQGRFSKANAGRLAPSGSGSSDYKDIKKNRNRFALLKELVVNFRHLLGYVDYRFRQPQTLHQVLIRGMERELCEECNYNRPNRINSRLIGYVRLLERGGKPDFFGISYIDDDLLPSRTALRHSETGLMDSILYVPFKNTAEIPDVLERFVQNTDYKCSIQVHILIRIIRQLNATIQSGDIFKDLIESRQFKS